MNFNEAILRTQLSALEEEYRKRKIEAQRYEIEIRRINRILQGMQVGSCVMQPPECET